MSFRQPALGSARPCRWSQCCIISRRPCSSCYAHTWCKTSDVAKERATCASGSLATSAAVLNPADGGTLLQHIPHARHSDKSAQQASGLIAWCRSQIWSWATAWAMEHLATWRLRSWLAGRWQSKSSRVRPALMGMLEMRRWAANVCECNRQASSSSLPLCAAKANASSFQKVSHRVRPALWGMLAMRRWPSAAPCGWAVSCCQLLPA